MTGAELIAEERKRQIEVEGWTAEHDDYYRDGELSGAGATYALDSFRFLTEREWYKFWPWSDKDWKPTPTNKVRQLVKAGALIAAEIDRIQRGKK